MNPLLLDFLGSIARWAVGAVFGILLSHGILTSDQVNSYLKEIGSDHTILWMLGFIIPLAWSLWNKVGLRTLINTALSTQPQSLADLQDHIRTTGSADPSTPANTQPRVVQK